VFGCCTPSLVQIAFSFAFSSKLSVRVREAKRRKDLHNDNTAQTKLKTEKLKNESGEKLRVKGGDNEQTREKGMREEDQEDLGIS